MWVVSCQNNVIFGMFFVFLVLSPGGLGGGSSSRYEIYSYGTMLVLVCVGESIETGTETKMEMETETCTELVMKVYQYMHNS